VGSGATVERAERKPVQMRLPGLPDRKLLFVRFGQQRDCRPVSENGGAYTASASGIDHVITPPPPS